MPASGAVHERELKRGSAKIVHQPRGSHILRRHKVPDSTLAHQRRQNAGFRSANHVEVVCAFIVKRYGCGEILEACSKSLNCWERDIIRLPAGPQAEISDHHELPSAAFSFQSVMATFGLPASVVVADRLEKSSESGRGIASVRMRPAPPAPADSHAQFASRRPGLRRQNVCSSTASEEACRGAIFFPARIH